jgi:hypothetical protein
MTEETVENPCSAPQGFGEPLPSTSPGWLVMSFAVVVTLISSVCTFFCTCLGVGLACFAALGDAAVPLAILCDVPPRGVSPRGVSPGEPLPVESGV